MKLASVSRRIVCGLSFSGLLFGCTLDGLFSDFADTAVAARVMFKLKNDPSYARCLVYDNGCTDRD